MRVADPLGRHAGRQIAQSLVGEPPDLGVEQGCVDQAAAAGLLALSERRQDADHRIDAGEDVGHRNSDAGRLALRQASDIHDPAHALDQEVVTGARRVGAVLAEAGDRAIDQPRIVGREALVVEPEFGEPADLEILDQDVGARRQLAHDALAIVGFEVELDRALAAIGRMVIGGVEMAAVGRRHEGRAPAAGVVAGAPAFHLDHVGAEIGEHLAGPRPRQDAGELEHAETGQRGRHQCILCWSRRFDDQASLWRAAGILSIWRERFCVESVLRRGRAVPPIGNVIAMNTSFFGELLQAISERGRALVERTRGRRGAAEHSESLVDMCEELVSVRGEASVTALARDILFRFAELTTGPRIAFFEALAHRFGPDLERLERAVEAWRKAPSDAAAAELHSAAEPRRQELLRRLNLAPGGTKALGTMREKVMAALDHRDDLAAVDGDFVHLFTSWFNRGFLVLRRIDWSTPAILLEKIIQHEAGHAIRDWNDLRARIDAPDRHCYAFFHPALNEDPLIFVEVALTRGIPGSID